jgi:hypothetical protein
MNFLMKLWPSYTPSSFIFKSDLQILRERILQAMLLMFTVLGLPSVTVASLSHLKNQSYTFPAIYFGVYFLFIALVVFRNIPYWLRGYAMITVVYLLGVSELFESGQLGEVRMFLITFVTLTAVLFTYKNVVFAIVLGLMTIISAGVYATVVPNPIGAMATVNLGTDWVTSSVVFFMIATILAGAVTMIIAGLESNLVKQAELALHLEQERSSLEDRIQERTNSMARRIVQLRTAADISRTLSALSNPDELLQQVVEIVKDRFGLYYVGVFLLDSSRETAV